MQSQRGWCRNNLWRIDGSRNSDPQWRGEFSSAMIASPKFLCDWRINQLCSADSSVGVNLNFDLVGVVIGVARISMMMSSGCGGHSSRGTRGSWGEAISLSV